MNKDVSREEISDFAKNLVELSKTVSAGYARRDLNQMRHSILNYCQLFVSVQHMSDRILNLEGAKAINLHSALIHHHDITDDEKQKIKAKAYELRAEAKKELETLETVFRILETGSEV